MGWKRDGVLEGGLSMGGNGVDENLYWGACQ